MATHLDIPVFTQKQDMTRHQAIGNANAVFTLITEPVQNMRLGVVRVVYSANVGVTVTITLLDAATNDAYNGTIQAIPLSAERYAFWLPEKDLFLKDGDQIQVAAPAGGASITAAITIDLIPTGTNIEGFAELIEPLLRKAGF